MQHVLNRRDLFRLAAAGAGTVALSSQAGLTANVTAQEGGAALNVGIFGEPGTLDFMQQADMAATIMDWNIYDQLAR
ncbi:MAG TPA: hypothetical protein VHG52_11725, partial [Thermomicrobiales bacterium]|nr:hypothetical protein [Thermomicrobiales bacterium]